MSKSQDQILRNASVALRTEQLYLETAVLTTNGSGHSMREQLDNIETYSDCVPTEYRCRQPIVCDNDAAFRTLDGTCNHATNSLLGSTYTQYRRLMAPVYSDGMRMHIFKKQNK